MSAPAGADKSDADRRFAACLPVILAAEGGFVNHPRDPGGATNRGITIGTLREWRQRPVTVDDVRRLTTDEAGAIYRARYWGPCGCDALPAGVDLMVFDFGVNAGPARALRLLRQTGGGGAPETIDRFAAARVAYYRSLPAFDAFGRGWLRRTEEVRLAARKMAR
jgi:lysozyme family protein